MKLLAINSSPRKGNTEFMLNIILNTAKENGADTELIELRKKDISYCSGGDNCCPVNLKCHIKDDMLKIYPKLEDADIILLSSPCYFFNVTARMKNFMDRCNPYYYSKKLKGKKFFLLSVGGCKPPIKYAIAAMERFVKGVHGKSIGSYSAVADKIGELETNQKVISDLRNLGKKLT
ncbi:MAG: flavodoxin family protein [Nanoarchaeota archaeon]|nr:flavodoxin family protein [Nanoarchaeota archaeon]